MSDPGVAALRAMRRHRQRRRLGDVEWFDAAYRVYLVALLGGGSVLWLSDLIGDDQVAADSAAQIVGRGPAFLGLLVVAAVAGGLRSGARGGPLALESADVAHVLLSPVSRHAALRRPVVQRLRSTMFSGVVGGALAGLLAARRLPGSPAAWIEGGALFGATLALLFTGAALVAHTSRLRPWIATATLIGGLGMQAAVAWSTGRVTGDVAARSRLDPAEGWFSPASLAGGLGLWGWRQRPIELLAVGVAVAVAIVGYLRLAHLSVDALSRRSSLVAQLRFAITMQDLRTVMLLRRQLNQERTRPQPWWSGRPLGREASRPHSVGAVVRRRGLRGVARFPLSKLVRMAALAAAAGFAVGVGVRGTTAALLLAGLVWFVLGLDALEPMSQEIDHSPLTDTLPAERGAVLSHHLVAPAAVLLPCAVISAAAAVLAAGSRAVAPAAILAVPLTLAAVCGAVVSVVRDAPDPFSAARQDAFVPPEMAGFTTAIKTIWPLVISSIGPMSTLTLQAAVTADRSLPAAAFRAAVGCMLVTAATVWWVRIRDRLRARLRAFIDEGRSYTNKTWS